MMRSDVRYPPVEEREGSGMRRRESRSSDRVFAKNVSSSTATWLPLLLNTAAFGLWIVVLSYSAGRASAPWAMLAFWIGVVVICLPFIIRLVVPSVGRQETIWVLVLLTVALQLMVFLSHPFAMAGYDEFLHWRTADDILRSGHLFNPNSLLLVSPLFPGLEIATTALISLSGLSIATAGTIVVGTAHLAMVLAIFLVFERLSGSHRMAGLGVVAYMGSSTFVYFETQYAYESLGLPMVAFVIFLLTWRNMAPRRERGIWAVMTVAAMATTVVSHHLSAIILTGILAMWAVVTHYMNRLDKRKTLPQPSLTWTVLVMFALLAAWLLTVARPTFEYLAPAVQAPVVLAEQLLSGESNPRNITAGTAQAGVNYERLVGIGSVALIMLGIAFGLIRWWHEHRYPSLSFLLGLAALAFPALPVLRLFDFTWEIANRLGGYVFLGVGYTMGLGFVLIRLNPIIARIRSLIVPLVLVVVVAAGIIGGSNPITRLPGPYMPGADERSIDFEATSTAEWMYAALGPNNRIAGDRVQTILMGSYGRQRAVTRPADGVDISGIFLVPSLGTGQLDTIRKANIRYIVVDRRISQALPLNGYYFEKWEQMVVEYKPPVGLAVLDKFYGMKGVSCIYDSGDMRIYDLGGLLSGS